MARPHAYISVDIDPVDRHLQGYGVDDAPPCPLVYERAVPRLLDVADQTGVKLTLYAIGRDANAHRAVLREAVARGHEVASHSWSHPQPFRTLSDATLQFELGASRATLTAAAGEEVLGFRSPAWDVDERVWAQCIATGYRYDASLFPSPMVLANRLSVFARGLARGHVDGRVFEMGGLGQIWGRTEIHDIRLGRASLVEIPMTVTPWLRLPYYHTLSFLLPRGVFGSLYRQVRRGGQALSYVLHAVDALGLREDRVDERLRVHPGMDRPLDAKLAHLRETFRRLATDYQCVPTREVLRRRR